MKSRHTIARLLILALLLGLLAACGDTATRRDDENPGSANATPTGAESPTPTTDPGDPTPTTDVSVTPTGEVTPTGAVNPTGAVTPTAEATPTNAATPTPAGPTATPGPDYSEFNLAGIWYCKERQGLESELSQCKDHPEMDYRLKIYNTYLEYVHSTDRINMETDVYELRTGFAEEEVKMYEKWGYGMTSYLADPTNPAKGHYIYSCTTGDSEGALFIIDVQSDGSLKTQFCYVMDNGSFPVFVDSVYTTEPVYPTGTYLEDFTGTWHCRSIAPYYEEAYELTGDNPLFSMDLVVYEDGTLDFIDVSGDIALAETQHYTLRTTGFSEAELAKYRKWDEDGFLVWEEKMPGEAEAAAKKGTNLLEGRLLYVCDEPAMNGMFIVLSWNKNFKQLDMDLYGYDTEISREYMEYLTYKRETVRKVTPGETFESYIGIWKMTEFRRAGEDTMTYCSTTDSYSPLEITFDKMGELLVAREVFSDRRVRYALRTETKANDPAWYADFYPDLELADTVTSFENHRLVFVCTDATYYPGSLLIIMRNPNGTFTARFFGKTSDGRVLDRPYNVFERVNGLGRTDDPTFKP